MAWDKQTGDALGNASRFLKRLRALEPGQRLDLHMHDFQDMLLPVHPLANLTWDEKAEWFRERTPFRCRVWRKEMENVYVFEREPKFIERT